MKENAKRTYFSAWLLSGASLVAQTGKNLPANVGDVGSMPGCVRSSGGGPGNPLHYFCLENPMDSGVWWAIVHGVIKSRT